MGATRLKATGLKKAFGQNVVLRSLDLEVASGEIHALIGGNGAGKSTLSKILAGLTAADDGALSLDGEPYAVASRQAAQERGVVMVLQELSIIPTLSVAENLFLGGLPSRVGIVDYRRLHEHATQALRRVGLGRLDPSMPAGSLGVGQQQLVEIAAGLAQRCRVLILDEPTAALSGAEAKVLFDVLGEFRAAGTSILYISHRLEEISQLADRVSVLRDGQLVATLSAATPREQLIQLMAGSAANPSPLARNSTKTWPALRVIDLHVGAAVRGVSLDVYSGEIVGLGGLVGAGRTELLRAIYGADRRSSGRTLLGENESEFVPHSPVDAVRKGVAFVPEDRKQHGIFAPLAVSYNAALMRLPERRGLPGWIDRTAERIKSARLLEDMRVRYADPDQPIAELSGGNQQKVVIGRWLPCGAALWLLDEPTRGVDVAARQGIYDRLRHLANAGAGILVASSDYEELATLCDRVIVLSNGTAARSFTRESLNTRDFMSACFAGFTPTGGAKLK